MPVQIFLCRCIHPHHVSPCRHENLYRLVVLTASGLTRHMWARVCSLQMAMERTWKGIKETLSEEDRQKERVCERERETSPETVRQQQRHYCDHCDCITDLKGAGPDAFQPAHFYSSILLQLMIIYVFWPVMWPPKEIHAGPSCLTTEVLLTSGEREIKNTQLWISCCDHTLVLCFLKGHENFPPRV